jgi:hypothetical protein
VLGDSVICNLGTESLSIKVECFPVLERNCCIHLLKGSQDTVVIYMSTNGLRRAGGLDYVMGDVYYIVNMAKTTF